MERVEFLPIGSLVFVKGGARKVLIIARGLTTKINEETMFFDYGGCMYPEGLVGDQILYFNHKDIIKAIQEGYKDEDDTMMVENINLWMEQTEVTRGNPYDLNKMNSKVE